ncbi:hypothetical protein CS8_041910 [Cupriavidus sp. 8B]
MGVGLVPRYFIEEELRSGAIAIAIGADVPSSLGYYLVYTVDRSNHPALSQFRDWLLDSDPTPI